MKVAVYQGLGCAHEFVEVKKGVPLSKSLPDLDFEHCAVVVNARLADGSYKPKCGDGIVIRVLPQSLAMVGVVLGVIGILAAVGTGIYAGVAAYQQKQELERQQKQLDLMTALMNPAAGSESINAPFLRGASNAVATGKSQPYVMGRAMFTPYLLTEKWYELEGVDGESQFVTQVLECGFGKQVLESLKAEDILLKTWAGGEPTEDATSLIDDSGSNNFSAGGVVEVAQDGNGFANLAAANWRVKSAVVKTEIPRTLDIAAGKKAKLVYTLDPCAKNVRLAITFAQGLAGSATVTPSYSLDGGETWIDFSFRHKDLTSYAEARYDYQYVTQNTDWTAALIMYYKGQGYEVDGSEFVDWARMAWRLKKRIAGAPVYTIVESNTVSRDTANEVRFEAVHEFSFADYQTLESNSQDCIMIKVEQGGQRNTNSRDQAHLLYYESQCFDPDESLEPAGVLCAEEYSKRHSGGNGLEMCPVISEKASSLSTMLALRMKASAANESASNKINIVTQSVARVVVNGEWTAASDKRPTSNPAAIMLEILQSHTHPLSAFTDEELDMDAFAELYKFCVEEEIEFNAVQTQKTMKSKLLEQVCAVCGASLFWNAEGKISVAWDHAQDTVVANLTPDSIISVEVEKTLSRPVDAMRISYIDETDWTRKTYTVLNNGVSRLNEDSVIRDLSVTGITKGEQIVKYGRYTMACMNIRQNTVRVRVGHEGMFFSPCSRITVLDDSLGDTPQNMLITRVSSNGDGWTLECVDYDARVYDAGEIPLRKPSIIQLDGASSGLPEVYAKKGEIDELVEALSEGTADLGAPTAPTIILCQASRDGIDLKCAPLGGGLDNSVKAVHWQVAKNVSCAPSEINDWRDFSGSLGEDTATADLTAYYTFKRSGQGADGYPEADSQAAQGWQNITYLNDAGSKWYFRAKVTNAYDKDSAWSVPVTVDTSLYGTWLIGTPFVVNDRVSGRAVTLTFDKRDDSTGRAPLYGDVYYKLEIRRMDSRTAEWFDPADSEDPYESVDNYKDGGKAATPSSVGSAVPQDPSELTAYILGGKHTEHAFSQTLPLEGQNDQLYQYQWYYERPIADPSNPTRDPYARPDSFGEPRKEGSGTAFSAAPPSADWDSVNKVLGDDDTTEHKLPGFFTVESGAERPWVHGAIGETGADSYTTDVYRHGKKEDVYELIKENGVDYSKAFYNGVYAEIVNGSFTINGIEWTISGGHVTNNVDAEVCDIFTATKFISYTLVDGMNPVDTAYQYKVRAFNLWAGDLVHYSGETVFNVTALATSVKDLVDGAITHNKLAEGAVWVDNLAAGSITAEKMAVKDLMAITGVFGKIQNNIIETEAHNKWDLEKGDFLVGNEYAVTDPQSDLAEYIKFEPAQRLGDVGKLTIKVANFIVAAITSIIRSLFVVVNRSGSTKNNLVAANPEYENSSETTDAPAKAESVPALTVVVNGDVQVKATTVTKADGVTQVTKSGNLSVAGTMSADSASVTRSLSAGDTTIGTSVSPKSLALFGSMECSGNIAATGDNSAISAKIVSAVSCVRTPALYGAKSLIENDFQELGQNRTRLVLLAAEGLSSYLLVGAYIISGDAKTNYIAGEFVTSGTTQCVKLFENTTYVSSNVNHHTASNRSDYYSWDVDIYTAALGNSRIFRTELDLA